MVYPRFLVSSQPFFIFSGCLISIIKDQFCPLCFTHLCYCLCLHGSKASIVFWGFPFLVAKRLIAWKEVISSRASGIFKLAILKHILKCCLINKVHE